MLRKADKRILRVTAIRLREAVRHSLAKTLKAGFYSLTSSKEQLMVVQKIDRHGAHVIYSVTQLPLMWLMWKELRPKV